MGKNGSFNYENPSKFMFFLDPLVEKKTEAVGYAQISDCRIPLGSKKRNRVISRSRSSGKTALPLIVVNTLGLYGHTIRGSGRCYVLDITLNLL